MPDASQLPESLSEFAFRNAAPVDVGRDFHVHMDRLTRSIDHILQTKDSPPLSAPHDTSDQGRIDLQSGQEPTPGATAPFRVSSQPTESAERKAASTPSAKPFPPQAPAASAAGCRERSRFPARLCCIQRSLDRRTRAYQSGLNALCRSPNEPPTRPDHDYFRGLARDCAHMV